MSIGSKHKFVYITRKLSILDESKFIFSSRLVCYHFQDVILLAENVDKDIGELFTFDEMFTKEYQPNDFTAKWLGGESCFVFIM